MRARATDCTCRGRSATLRRDSSCCDAKIGAARAPTRRWCVATVSREPRLGLGKALRGVASAAIDVSDGLLGDLDKLCAASGVAAVVELERLPLSSALRASFEAAAAERLALGGGDDYELLFTVPPDAERGLETRLGAAVAITRIGAIVAGRGVKCLRAGHPVAAGIAGHDHFAG